MTAITLGARSALRATVTLVVAAALYEAIARTGYFPPALMPTLSKVVIALVVSLLDGSMIGLALEKLVFERLEHYTVVRWGMMQS